MSLLRSLGSVVRPVARRMMSVPKHQQLVSQPWTYSFRAFATDPGFLDRADVSNRVLEVVRKFEKVGLRLMAFSRIRNWLRGACVSLLYSLLFGVPFVLALKLRQRINSFHRYFRKYQGKKSNYIFVHRDFDLFFSR